MFIDETELTVSSGRGGDGVVTFRREKYVPRGGPDGGDGGRGGDVVLKTSLGPTTLSGIQHGRHYRAEAGQPGRGRIRHGRSGESLVIEVPVGTVVRDAERGHVLRDMSGTDDEVVVAAGGAGGRGNKHFAHATNQTPRRATEGRQGETRRLVLELRLVADVGLVGLPNAGKSTFLARVSSARPKVAEYPFTTLAPMLGVVDLDGDDLVVADIPGLIEGAHAGAGLGDRFLRHVARTRVLLHLVDGCVGLDQALVDWRTIRQELERSRIGLGDKPTVVAVSRADADPEGARAIAEALAPLCGQAVAPLSCHSGEGLTSLVQRLRQAVNDLRETPARPPRPPPPHLRPQDDEAPTPGDA